MTDESAFLRSILERPDDDGPRLVMADWLEERGECERAEFIRVQIALSGQGGAKVFPFNGPTFDDLRRRERELLWSHGLSWAKAAGCTECHIEGPTANAQNTDGFILGILRRGFVEEIALSWAAWGGGGRCGRCDGRRFLGAPAPGQHGYIGAPPCPACSGTGRTPGHAAELLSATPIRRVRLTTMPVIAQGSTREQMLSVLRQWWPGVTFELPAVSTAVPVVESPYQTVSREAARLMAEQIEAAFSE